MTLTAAELAPSVATGRGLGPVFSNKEEPPVTSPPTGAAALVDVFTTERDDGLTFREIGERHGLSHERVRQVLVDGGVPQHNRNWVAEHRKQELADEITAWLNEQGPTVSDTVREHFGLSVGQLSELFHRGIPRHLVLASGGRTGSSFSNEDLVKAVRTSWTRYKKEHPGAKGFSVGAYDAARIDGDPSPALITARIPWKIICATAGVPCSAGRGNYQRLWSDDDLISWVGKYSEAAAADGTRVTFYGYDAWRRSQEGAPSGALLRTRLRRAGYATWGSMVATAAGTKS
jgi:Sigma-70, region 4